jgi:hypothetical protein
MLIQKLTVKKNLFLKMQKVPSAANSASSPTGGEQVKLEPGSTPLNRGHPNTTKFVSAVKV